MPERCRRLQYSKAFLQTCVANSKATRVVLGPKREVGERDVKSSRSLNSLWKSTIAVADAEIFLPNRENPENHWMVLKRPKYHSGSTDKRPSRPDQQLNSPQRRQRDGTQYSTQT